ncbi:MAG: hypothetical protein Q9222_003073 [Ikaeria aurantiellina]
MDFLLVNIICHPSINAHMLATVFNFRYEYAHLNITEQDVYETTYDMGSNPNKTKALSTRYRYLKAQHRGPTDDKCIPEQIRQFWFSFRQWAAKVEKRAEVLTVVRTIDEESRDFFGKFANGDGTILERMQMVATSWSKST